jgi:hypothetical protein
MKGFRLYQLLTELNKTEHRQLVHQCKLSSDKRSVVYCDLLRKRKITEKSLDSWLNQMAEEWSAKNDSEREKKKRRWLDFACKEIEDLLLKNHFQSNPIRHSKLSEIFDSRNQEFLTDYYNNIAIKNSIIDKDYDTLIREYDTKLRWLGRNQTEKNIEHIGKILLDRKSITDTRNDETMSYFYTVCSALYIDNPSPKWYTDIQPTKNEFSALSKRAKDDFSGIMYQLAEARFNFYNQKNFNQLLSKIKLSIETSSLDIKSQKLLYRSLLYLSLTGAVYYHYPIQKNVDDAQEMFAIMLDFKIYDTIGYFFLLFSLLQLEDLQKFDLTYKKYKKQFLTSERSDYFLFLDSYRLYLDKKQAKSLQLLQQTAYSRSNYIAIWSKLLEIKIHIDELNTDYAKILMERAKRFLKIHQAHKIIFDPASKSISILEKRLKGKEPQEKNQLPFFYSLMIN